MTAFENTVHDEPSASLAQSPSEAVPQRKPGHGDPRTAALVVLPGVVLATVLTAWNYSSKPLWRDEWFTYSTVERPFTGMVQLLADKDGGLSGFYLVMHAWMLLGDSVAWMRLPAALCTVLLAAITALVGRRLGGLAVGVVSGVLIAVMPTVIDHAQEARAYPLVLAAITATGLAALRYQDQPSRGRAFALAALAFLAAGLHPLPGAPAVAGIFAGLLLCPGAASRWRIVLAGAPAALVTAVLIAAGLDQNGVTDGANVEGLGQVLNVRFLVAPDWGLLLAMLVLSTLSLVVLRRRRDALMVLLAWIALPLVSLTALIAMGSFFKPRYTSAIVPAAAVLVAIGIVTIAAFVARTLVSRHRCAVQTSVVSVITAGLVVSLLPYAAGVVTRPFQTDDPRAATDALFASYREGDAVVYSGSIARGLTDYYATGDEDLKDPLLVASPLASNSVQGDEVPVDQTAAALTDVDRLWVVGTMSRPGDRWASEEKVDAATEGRTLVTSDTFGRYRLQLWETQSR